MEEDRYICLGRLHDTVIFFVVFTERGENIHLITARKADPIEEMLYYAHYEKETRGN
ncbi:MAG: BrnT family toxin [Spirochaetes bacterium]|nr:BrnT family toxin [Spirochaetota bacterium]